MPNLRPKPLRHRESLRQMSVAEEFRLSRLCVLMNPILPVAIHPDLAGEMPETNALAVQDSPGLSWTARGQARGELEIGVGTKRVRTA
jgi:hypothetical protein